MAVTFVPLSRSLSKSTYCWLARFEAEAASCAPTLPVTTTVRMSVSKKISSLFIVEMHP